MDARVEQRRPADLEVLIEQLNVDLSLEYMAMVQYAQHAGVLAGKDALEIPRDLGNLAAEELRHALTLTTQISLLGGVPTVKVLKARTSPDQATMLGQDLRGEEAAIGRYLARIGQAEALGLFDLGRRLREILAMEHEHVQRLRKVLRQEEMA